ncbi:hydroxymethylbilane synthase [Oscillochloris sp. ZM17-4]|uniref:hydroxymethylbilane synthase n=1 Tax=Oscillochloris sp. ZM17-4 TaxID=2866714 RepID=UPI001C735D00|nr:hydroxymethylbilane synthase [Oscillochloris sp. ZM17-4]MBX0326374.1 hydroxymethylbilane synthase [Oscillochloris sp. ZM17-4]
MGQKTLILGTRGSKLALTQSEMMAAALRAANPGLAVELKIISTKGDRILDVALSAVGDKGLFVKELEQALLDHEVDLCVHSCKDLPSVVPDGLTLAAFPERADPRDALVINAASPEGDRASASILTLPTGTVVGTSSLRRASQIRAVRPDLQLRDVRGNVDTRLRKLAEGQYEALVLASAGLDRLGFTDSTVDGPRPFTAVDASFVSLPISAEQMLPAVAQGILAIECRADDALTIGALAALDHAPSRAAALAERAFLGRLEGGCQVPIAAHATLAGDSLSLRGMVGSLDGLNVISAERTGDLSDPAAIGVALAEDLLARGAAEILAELATAKQ